MENFVRYEANGPKIMIKMSLFRPNGHENKKCMALLSQCRSCAPGRQPPCRYYRVPRHSPANCRTASPFGRPPAPVGRPLLPGSRLRPLPSGSRRPRPPCVCHHPPARFQSAPDSLQADPNRLPASACARRPGTGRLPARFSPAPGGSPRRSLPRGARSRFCPGLPP